MHWLVEGQPRACVWLAGAHEHSNWTLLISWRPRYQRISRSVNIYTTYNILIFSSINGIESCYVCDQYSVMTMLKPASTWFPVFHIRSSNISVWPFKRCHKLCGTISGNCIKIFPINTRINNLLITTLNDPHIDFYADSGAACLCTNKTNRYYYIAFYYPNYNQFRH